MKVILLKDINGLGKKFEVKNVKDGYGRNFLIPRGIAKAATPEVMRELDSHKAGWEMKERETKKQLEILAKELNGKEIRFTLKTGKKKEVFGSVSSDDIKKALKEVSVLECEIELNKPIKSLGEHEVVVNLTRGIKTNVKVIIEPEEK